MPTAFAYITCSGSIMRHAQKLHGSSLNHLTEPYLEISDEILPKLYQG